MAEFLGALPPEDLYFIPDPHEQRRPLKPLAVAAPSGTKALVIDVNSKAHVLARSGVGWDVVTSAALPLSAEWPPRIRFSSGEHTVAISSKGGDSRTVLATMATDGREVKVISVIEAGELLSVSEDGRRVRVQPDGKGNARWFDMDEGWAEQENIRGSEMSRSGDRTLLLLRGQEPGPWPAVARVAPDSWNSAASLFSIVDASSGELLCRQLTYSANSGLLTAPDLSVSIDGSADRSRAGLRLCKPIRDPSAALRKLRATLVEG